MHRPFVALAFAVAAVACGGSSASGKGSTTVFDPSGGGARALPVDVMANAQIEKPYAPLDSAGAGDEAWRGVSVLGGDVRFSRPTHWAIRDASVEPGQQYIRYVSPHAYSFAIYERSDAPDRSWRDVLDHYENDVVANGAKALGQRVPVATPANQGRAYTIDRKIESKEPVLSRSREILLRGDHRVVLVQIVSQEENLARISGELLEILRRLEVL
jgi:hypothetical protein